MKTRLLFSWIMVFCLCGCSQPPAAVVKVVLHLPGTTPDMANSLGATVRNALFAAPHVEHIETVARSGQWEAYVQIRSNNAIQDVRSSTQSAALPTDAAGLDYSIQAGGMPEIVPVMKPEAKVVVDLQKASAFGMTNKDIMDAVRAAITTDKSVDLGDIAVATRNGAIVRVRDVATIEIKSMPDCIVQHW